MAGPADGDIAAARAVKVAVRIVLAFVLLVVGARVYGAWRWQRRTDTLRARMQAIRIKPVVHAYDPREIAELPAPVRRYFERALTPGQPIIVVAELTQTGTFRMKEEVDRWSVFTATQLVTTSPAGFDWDARIRMAPAISAHVHDSYVAREGMLHAEALGLLTVADIRASAIGTQAEFLRYFAEAPWYPTSLLPSQGVRWTAVDDTTAKATMVDGTVSATLEFRFGADGMIHELHAVARYHSDVNGAPVFYPWSGRFWDYARRNGMRVPMSAAVRWRLSDGDLEYFRGHIDAISFRFAE